MKHLTAKLKIDVNEKVYVKNPDSSDLGKKILAGSIDLIDEMGFESFTFKKLAEELDFIET
ncbi:MAG: TetR/AcrR family transcriptional regulator, partial [Bacteroidota bacterium]